MMPEKPTLGRIKSACMKQFPRKSRGTILKRLFNKVTSQQPKLSTSQQNVAPGVIVLFPKSLLEFHEIISFKTAVKRYKKQKINEIKEIGFETKKQLEEEQRQMNILQIRENEIQNGIEMIEAHSRFHGVPLDDLVELLGIKWLFEERSKKKEIIQMYNHKNKSHQNLIKESEKVDSVQVFENSSQTMLDTQKESAKTSSQIATDIVTSLESVTAIQDICFVNEQSQQYTEVIPWEGLPNDPDDLLVSFREIKNLHRISLEERKQLALEDNPSMSELSENLLRGIGHVHIYPFQLPDKVARIPKSVIQKLLRMPDLKIVTFHFMFDDKYVYKIKNLSLMIRMINKHVNTIEYKVFQTHPSVLKRPLIPWSEYSGLYENIRELDILVQGPCAVSEKCMKELVHLKNLEKFTIKVENFVSSREVYSIKHRSPIHDASEFIPILSNVIYFNLSIDGRLPSKNGHFNTDLKDDIIQVDVQALYSLTKTCYPSWLNLVKSLEIDMINWKESMKTQRRFVLFLKRLEHLKFQNIDMNPDGASGVLKVMKDLSKHAHNIRYIEMPDMPFHAIPELRNFIPNIEALNLSTKKQLNVHNSLPPNITLNEESINLLKHAPNLKLLQVPVPHTALDLKYLIQFLSPYEPEKFVTREVTNTLDTNFTTAEEIVVELESVFSRLEKNTLRRCVSGNENKFKLRSKRQSLKRIGNSSIEYFLKKRCQIAKWLPHRSLSHAVRSSVG